MRHQKYLSFALVMLCFSGALYGQRNPESTPGHNVREWTSIEGKKLMAEYLGIQGPNVVLKLPNGKITPVALARFSEADNAFIKQNPLEYRVAWQAWPKAAQARIINVDVTESAGEAGAFVYTTPHFRFQTDVNLGTTLMKELARAFELTYDLHTMSPFGILAHPDGRYYQARLISSTEKYHSEGGPSGSIGVYMLKDKVFLASLQEMGVRNGSAGWRKVSSSVYDPSLVVHELTHMLTHDMLDNLPVWMNEGYAEYVSNIPIEGDSFRVSGDKIRLGVRKHFAVTGGFHPGGPVTQLYHVGHVLTMTDQEWVTGKAPTGTGEVAQTYAHPDVDRLRRLYRTAHLIIYYFIQIEGEKGVAKIRRFLDENRGHMARYNEYRNNFKLYEEQMAAFLNLPGVSKLPDGRIQYPSDLVAPKAPEPPFTDPNMVKMGGIEALLGGESAEVVGARIESELEQDLKLGLVFKDS